MTDQDRQIDVEPYLSAIFEARDLSLELCRGTIDRGR